MTISVKTYYNFLLEKKKDRTRWYDPEKGVGNLIGKTLTNVNVQNDQIIFTTVGGSKYMMYHEQNCCESVEVDDIVGDVEDLIGTPIIKATEDTNNDDPPPDRDDYRYGYESYTWTFYNISTVKGHVTIRWFGSSNGYYSESVDFVELDEDGQIRIY